MKFYIGILAITKMIVGLNWDYKLHGEDWKDIKGYEKCASEN